MSAAPRRKAAGQARRDQAHAAIGPVILPRTNCRLHYRLVSKGLVDQVYSLLGTNRTPLEEQVYLRNQYDATLDLLERRYPGQRAAVRRVLIEVLKPKLRRRGATETHAALLQLARSRAGVVRLVTTNFDRIFEHLIAHTKPAICAYPAPLLPIPKSSRWDGVVYLHGLLPKTSEESALH